MDKPYPWFPDTWVGREDARVVLLTRPVFDSSIWKNGPSPWEIGTFKGQVEVKISNGSGIWDPRFEIVWTVIRRTDRSFLGDTALQHFRGFLSTNYVSMCVYVYIYIYTYTHDCHTNCRNLQSRTIRKSFLCLCCLLCVMHFMILYCVFLFTAILQNNQETTISSICIGAALQPVSVLLFY